MKNFFDIAFVVFCMCDVAYLIDTYRTMSVGRFVLNLFFIGILSSAMTIYLANFIHSIAKEKQKEEEVE